VKEQKHQKERRAAMTMNRGKPSQVRMCTRYPLCIQGTQDVVASKNQLAEVLAGNARTQPRLRKRLEGWHAAMHGRRCTLVGALQFIVIQGAATNGRPTTLVAHLSHLDPVRDTAEHAKKS